MNELFSATGVHPPRGLQAAFGSSQNMGMSADTSIEIPSDDES